MSQSNTTDATSTGKKQSVKTEYRTAVNGGDC